MADDYHVRKEALGLDDPEEIKRYLKLPNVVVLDVRTHEEIMQDKHETSVASGCTVTECPVLEGNPESVLPDKDG